MKELPIKDIYIDRDKSQITSERAWGKIVKIANKIMNSCNGRLTRYR